MDNLDELFDGMPEPDAGLDFVIDESKRLIAVPEEGVVLGVEGDKDGTASVCASIATIAAVTLPILRFG